MALASPDDVRAHVLRHAPPLEAVESPVADALGTVAAGDVVAAEYVPPFANSAMDGFAVRADDVRAVPVSLDVITTIAAGDDPTDVSVAPGQAARIMTGAAMPAGADAVVMIEETDGGPDTRVEIRRTVGPGDFVRQAGEDVKPGDVLVVAGDRLNPARVGLLAAAGCISVAVVPRPRVGVLSTGDELVPAGQPLRPGQIRDSNRALLVGLLSEGGFDAVDLGVASDDRDAIAGALREATSRCDAVLTSGGVSVGDFDFLAPVLAGLGEVWKYQIAIKPAKPFVFGVTGGTPVFALPGNPVSAAVSFELFARPALRQMAGCRADDLLQPVVRAVAAEPLARRADGKTHYVRVVTRWQADGRLSVRSAGGQGSHVLSALAASDALAVLPDGDGVGQGDDVDVLLLR
jgi:molybdenum cofactor synthesis domain-containing protein